MKSSKVDFWGHLFSLVQSLSHIRLFATPWTAAHEASLSITNSRSLLKLMPSNHLILCRPLLFLPSIFPSIRVFSNESVLCIRWPEYWSFKSGGFGAEAPGGLGGRFGEGLAAPAHLHRLRPPSTRQPLPGAACPGRAAPRCRARRARAQEWRRQRRRRPARRPGAEGRRGQATRGCCGEGGRGGRRGREGAGLRAGPSSAPLLGCLPAPARRWLGDAWGSGRAADPGPGRGRCVLPDPRLLSARPPPHSGHSGLARPRGFYFCRRGRGPRALDPEQRTQTGGAGRGPGSECCRPRLPFGFWLRDSRIAKENQQP